jgi:regulator of sigma D
MLTQVEQAKEKWGGAHTAIDHCLNERKQLLIQYCKLAGLPPFERHSGALPDKTSIEFFCELLMDYISTGHFAMYDKITKECANNNSGQSEAASLCSEISSLTDEALNFNDHFAAFDLEQDLATFDQNLSNLGQNLEQRFELEDKLIQVLHTEHL